MRIDHRYDDIIALPHPISHRHTPMPLSVRAAQFMPFAALTGYEALICEEARLTDRKLEPDEEALFRLNERLKLLEACFPARPTVTVTRFIPDAKKTGGHYETTTCRLKRVDTVKNVLIIDDGKEIPFDDLLTLESEIFPDFRDHA